MNKAVFATFVVLRPGTSLETGFTYDLPDGVLQQEGESYRCGFSAPKQQATDQVPLDVTIQLPQDSELEDAQPRSWAVIEYAPLDLHLETDFELELGWKFPAGACPKILPLYLWLEPPGRRHLLPGSR